MADPLFSNINRAMSAVVHDVMVNDEKLVTIKALISRIKNKRVERPLCFL